MKRTLPARKSPALSPPTFPIPALGGLLIATALTATPAAFAGETVGMVKTSKAPAFVVRQGQEIPAHIGMPVYAADRLKTGREGALGVALKDDTLISTGPNSNLTVEGFSFNSTTHEGSMLLSVIKGTLSMISGLIVKANPEAARIRTPQATIGIRGTEFIVEVEGEDEGRE